MAIAMSRLTRTLTLAAALASLTACSAEVEGPSAQDAREAGREYGRAIVDTLGSRADVGEMKALCGQGAREEGPVSAGEGNGGDGLADEIDAFVEGCREVVTEK